MKKSNGFHSTSAIQCFLKGFFKDKSLLSVGCLPRGYIHHLLLRCHHHRNGRLLCHLQSVHHMNPYHFLFRNHNRQIFLLQNDHHKNHSCPFLLCYHYSYHSYPFHFPYFHHPIHSCLP